MIRAVNCIRAKGLQYCLSLLDEVEAVDLSPDKALQPFMDPLPELLHHIMTVRKTVGQTLISQLGHSHIFPFACRDFYTSLSVQIFLNSKRSL